MKSTPAINQEVDADHWQQKEEKYEKETLTCPPTSPQLTNTNLYYAIFSCTPGNHRCQSKQRLYNLAECLSENL